MMFFVVFMTTRINVAVENQKQECSLKLKKWNINLKKSIMIGDRKKDIDAGKKAGCKNFFIDYNYDEPKPSKKNCTYIKSFNEITRYIE